jgi:hypothetical protein
MGRQKINLSTERTGVALTVACVPHTSCPSGPKRSKASAPPPPHKRNQHIYHYLMCDLQLKYATLNVVKKVRKFIPYAFSAGKLYVQINGLTNTKWFPITAVIRPCLSKTMHVTAMKRFSHYSGVIL